MENVRPIRYGACVSARRLAGYYGCADVTMRAWLSRAEFSKYLTKFMRPIQYHWCKEMEKELDAFANKKGFYRCTDLKAHSKFLWENESLYSI